MSRNKFLIMLLVFSLLLFFVWKDLQSEKELSEDLSKSNSLVVLNDLSSVALKDGDESFELVRAGEDWKLAGLPNARVNEKAIETFFSALAALSSQEKLEQAKSEGLYGLDQPSFLLTLGSAKEGSKTISFGKQNPISKRRYASLSSEDGVFMVDESLYQDLKRPELELRDRTPIDFKIEDVSSLVIRRNKFELIVLRKDKLGRFYFQSPSERIPLDSELMEVNLRAIQNIEAAKFIDTPDANLGKYGLAPEKLVLGLNFGGESFEEEAPKKGGSFSKTTDYQLGPKALVLYFGEADSLEDSVRNYFLQLKGDLTIYQYSPAPYNDFLQDLALLRDRTPFDEITLADVKSLDVKYLGKKKDLSPEARSRLIEGVRGLRALTYLSSGSSEMNDAFSKGADLEVQFSVEGFSRPFSLKVGKSLEAMSRGHSSEDAPKYSLLKSIDGAEVGAVISSYTWGELAKEF